MQIYAELLMSLPLSTPALATAKMMTMRVTLKYEATLPSPCQRAPVLHLKLGPAMIGFFSLFPGRGWLWKRINRARLLTVPIRISPVVVVVAAAFYGWGLNFY